MANIIFHQRFLRRRIFRVGCIVAATLLLEFIGVLAPVQNLLRTLWIPVQTLTVGAIYHGMTPYRIGGQLLHAAERIQDLELRYAEAAVQLNDLQALRAKADALSQLCEASESGTIQARHVLAPIISYGQPMIRWSGADGGANQADEHPGSVFVAGILIGRLQASKGEYTPVTLLSSPQLSPILAQTTDGVTGLIRGDGQRILLQEVPIQDTLVVGQMVRTIGQPGIEPNVTIGKIKSILRSEGEVTQAAEVEQPVSFYTTQWVEVRR